MIIPVRCVTCGKVLGDKWREYQKRVSDAAPKKADDEEPPDGLRDGLVGTRHARVLDDMGIVKLCCRRHMLTNVDAMDRI